MFIKTIVFNNNPKNLGEIYIPLTLENKECKIQEKISDYPNTLMEEYNKIVITDSAGMGKSTLLKFMFLRAINLNKGIPIFIELRKLNNEHTVIDEIMKEINPINSNVDKHKVLDLISEGDFIFF
ncbi:hypothetical protein [Exiguobacterium sp. s22]|uniref:hypothetical protein n=1 Tax=Exiguobacterium sp. s22 TaxID=2751272 RepID=UPI001BE51E4D|nr:hypothetical protein [Exiguobacterium sp. s22]